MTLVLLKPFSAQTPVEGRQLLVFSDALCSVSLSTLGLSLVSGDVLLLPLLFNLFARFCLQARRQWFPSVRSMFFNTSCRNFCSIFTWLSTKSTVWSPELGNRQGCCCLDVVKSAVYVIRVDILVACVELQAVLEKSYCMNLLAICQHLCPVWLRWTQTASRMICWRRKMFSCHLTWHARSNTPLISRIYQTYPSGMEPTGNIWKCFADDLRGITLKHRQMFGLALVAAPATTVGFSLLVLVLVRWGKLRNISLPISLVKLCKWQRQPWGENMFSVSCSPAATEASSLISEQQQQLGYQTKKQTNNHDSDNSM